MMFLEALEQIFLYLAPSLFLGMKHFVQEILPHLV